MGGEGWTEDVRRHAYQLFAGVSRCLRRSSFVAALPFADTVHSWLYRRLRAKSPVRVGEFSFYLDPRSAMSKKLELYGSLAALENHVVFDFLREGDVVLDVGAHAGVFSVPSSRAVGPDGSVVAFEPNPNVLPLLRRNLEENDCKNVEVVELAVAETAGLAILTDHDRSLGFSSLRSFGGRSRTFEVETVSLDEFLARRRLAPDLIKVDVEGAEALVVEGSTSTLQRHPDCIFVLELHPLIARFGHEVRDVLDPLERAGHRLHLIVDGEHLEPTTAEAVHGIMEQQPRRMHLVSCANPRLLGVPMSVRGRD